MKSDGATSLARQFVSQLTLRQRCGQLLVIGFEGTELPPTIRRSLSDGFRGGAILFRRNLETLDGAAHLCREIADAAPAHLTPLIAVDEEGGRVTRLPVPFRPLPPMRRFGEIGDEPLVFRAASIIARQLHSLGINCNFAPVLDVDSNPQNPIIGDRSFSDSVAVVSQMGLAFARGLVQNGVLACAKHFPGHGDTQTDSHLGLPTVEHDLHRIHRVELAPFAAAARAGMPSFMTAHIVFPHLDATRLPATLSRVILQDLLRHQLEFSGVVFSDDLEMRAIADTWSVPDAACRAVAAGCDALLICRSEDAAEATLDALTAAATRDEGLARRVEEAAIRFLGVRLRFPPLPTGEERQRAMLVLGELRFSADELLTEIEARSRLVPRESPNSHWNS